MKQTTASDGNGLLSGTISKSYSPPPPFSAIKLEDSRLIHSGSGRGPIEHLTTFKGLPSKQSSKSLSGQETESTACSTALSSVVSIPGYLNNNLSISIDDCLGKQTKEPKYIVENGVNKGSNKSPKKRKASQSKHLTKDNPPFKYAGIVASLVGALFFSCQTVSIKLLPSPHSINEKAKALWFRGFFILIFCVIASIYNKTSLKVPRNEIWINGLRCLFGVTSTFGGFCALSFIGAGESKAIIFSSPIWISIASRYIFHEPFKFIQILAVPGTILGVVLLAHPSLLLGESSSILDHPLLSSSILNLHLEPPNDWLEHNSTGTVETIHDDGFTSEKRWIGLILSLAVSFLATANYIVLTFKRKTPVQATTFWLGISMILTSTVVMSCIGFGTMPDTVYEWTILLILGICAWAGQSLLQWAFLYEKASVLGIVRTSDVAFTFLLSALLLDDPIYWTSLAGALLISIIVVSLILNDILQKYFCPSKEYSTTKAASSKPQLGHQQVYTISNGKLPN